METSDKGMEGRSYCSIGNCLRAMVQPEKANECYTRVCRIYVQYVITINCKAIYVLYSKLIGNMIVYIMLVSCKRWHIIY